MKGGHRRFFAPPVDPRKDRDEDLLLFHEMRRREKERIVSLLQPVSDDLESNSGNYPIYRIPSAKKGTGNDFFGFENDKNDYDWLKTPPATPLFPSLEMDAASAGPNFVIQKEIPILQPIKYSRFAGNKSSEAPKANLTTKPSNPKSSASSRSVTPNPTPGVTFKPLPPTKATPPPSAKPMHSNPDSNRKPNFSSISAKPTNPKQAFSNAGTETTETGNRTNVTDPKPRSRGMSPLVRSRIPATIPGFSNDTPPNLRTTAPSDRPSSASRGRPGNPVAVPGRSSSTTRGRPVNPVTVSDRAPSATRDRPNQMTDTKQEVGNTRRQSCSPSVARGRRPEFRKENEQIKTGNGLVLGSQMVEKVMNARRSAGGDEKQQNQKPKYRGGDVSGFGRLMSKSSLDMALKHMEIRRSSNIHQYNTLSGRNFAAASSNSSLNLSPRSANKETDLKKRWEA